VILSLKRKHPVEGLMSEPHSNATVLIADDDEANRDLLSGLLTGEGYHVVCVEDGEGAVRAVHGGRVDLALLDVLMPGKSGFSACMAIKSRPETRLVPVVLVTGLTSSDDRIQGIMCGADDFLCKPINKYELLARVNSLLRMKEFTDELENAETVLFSLALSIEAKDRYTEGHCERLSKYSVAMAERLGLPDELRVALRRAGVVHDIGKIGVPEPILTKPGPLNDEEWRVMKQHPVIGERICAPLKSFRHVLPVIRHHHEKLDGSGYPDGLSGDQIPLTARILQIADVYDALTSERPYRTAIQPHEALGIVRDEVRRGWWDGAVVDEFEAVILGSKPLQPARSGS
jgi:putative two-component system response regulator